MFVMPRASPVPVSFYPDFRETNPYQQLLYDAVGPTIDARPEPLSALVARLAVRPGPAIFHVHWEDAVAFLPGMTPERFLDDLVRLKDAGGRVVWSLHNLEPHEERYRVFAAELRAGLIDLADVLHVHSLPALAAAIAVWPLPMHRVRIVPHGNYDGAYPIIGRHEARAGLGLSGARMVLLLPGRIGAYKSPVALVTAFVNAAGPDDRLIVAGETMWEAASLPADHRVLVMSEFQSSEDFSRCHAAADAVVLPYRESLTSGSGVLAATLGRGILGADTPGLRDVVSSPAMGTLYDDAPGSLGSALARALTEGPEVWARRGQAAELEARARDWRAIGPVWRDIYLTLALAAPPRRVVEPQPCG